MVPVVHKNHYIFLFKSMYIDEILFHVQDIIPTADSGKKVEVILV